MNRTLTHRGPDDEGYYVDGPVGLAHRRLSIIDIAGGHQPMITDDGRFILVYNGEIYNFLDLRAELELAGEVFKTRSDSEVLLRLYTKLGPSFLNRLNGMFAFAIWDKATQRLFAARDRMGKKPFYYWDSPKLFAFASECKAFKAHPDFSADLNREALRHYFQYEYVPAPYSIYQGVKKLPAAHYLIVENNEVTITRYWDIPLCGHNESISEEEAQKNILEHLDRAVNCRLISDVPLGVFLSGGIDSSSIVGLMARQREGKDIKTFSVGFKEKSFDESGHALFVAQKFGTDHHQQTLTPQKMIEILPEVIDFLDEPFADYSIIPTYLLSQFTRQKVTVALGGDGSDEMFAGYPTFLAAQLVEIYKKFPGFMKKMASAVRHLLPVSYKDNSFDFKVRQFLYGARFPAVQCNQVWLGAFHQEDQGQLFINGGDKACAFTNPLDLVTDVVKNCPSDQLLDRVLYFYQKFYLCDDILVKTDRASMATSLEVRAPFLDVNLVEYVSQLPYSMKLRRTQTKYILKKALESVLPHQILYRKKKGFGIPIAVWLTNELKGKMMATLNREKIKKEGIFNPDYIDRLVQEHISGKRNNRKQLFSLLMFEWWREKYL